mmetsp:Transcript_46650/g.73021  ORF Transcript_46650/g.73021 Transcript_46650/m.73021 type:complete len:378 (+) Transcript_46650:1037-2170(+)
MKYSVFYNGNLPKLILQKQEIVRRVFFFFLRNNKILKNKSFNAIILLNNIFRRAIIYEISNFVCPEQIDIEPVYKGNMTFSYLNNSRFKGLIHKSKQFLFPENNSHYLFPNISNFEICVEFYRQKNDYFDFSPQQPCEIFKPHLIGKLKKKIKYSSKAKFKVISIRKDDFYELFSTKIIILKTTKKIYEPWKKNYPSLMINLKKFDIVRLRNEDSFKIVCEKKGKFIDLQNIFGEKTKVKEKILIKLIEEINPPCQEATDKKGNIIRNGDLVRINNMKNASAKGTVLFIQDNFLFVKITKKLVDVIISKRLFELEVPKNTFLFPNKRKLIINKDVLIREGRYKGYPAHLITANESNAVVKLISNGKILNIQLKFLSL